MEADMGCDIHAYSERRTPDGYELVSAVFDWRSYGAFAFLAGVRNYSAVPAISSPRGLPADVSQEVRERFDDWGTDAHTPSWLSVSELAAWNYSGEVEDRRYTRQEAPGLFNGGATADVGAGTKTTWRDFLGDKFLEDICKMQDAGADRVVFWFDN